MFKIIKQTEKWVLYTDGGKQYLCSYKIFVKKYGNNL